MLKNLKSLSLALALLGVFAVTLLIAWSGFDRVASSVLSVGFWGFVFLSGWQLLVASVLGIAWRAVAQIAPKSRALAVNGLFIWARLVRDASASCLPFSQLGGFAIGARVLVLHGRSWEAAAASTIGDTTAEFLAEIIFTAGTLVIVLARGFDAAWVAPSALAAALLLIGVGCLYLPSRAARLCGSLAGRIAARGFGFKGARLRSIESELQRLYRRAGSFSASNALHVLGWIAKGAGGWIAFRLLGAPISFLDALAVEALLHAGLAFAVFVPGYLGVQEGGYMLLGAAFGVPPEIALGTSLLRRGRDIAIGVPVLLIWQGLELRRLRVAR